jgi:hypothetical protein
MSFSPAPHIWPKKDPYTHLSNITTFTSSSWSRMIYITLLFISKLRYIAFQLLAKFQINIRNTTLGIHVARCVFGVTSTANLDFLTLASNALQILRLFRSTHFCTLPLLVTACSHSLASRSIATWQFFRLQISASLRQDHLLQPRKYSF